MYMCLTSGSARACRIGSRNDAQRRARAHPCSRLHDCLYEPHRARCSDVKARLPPAAGLIRVSATRIPACEKDNIMIIRSNAQRKIKDASRQHGPLSTLYAKAREARVLQLQLGVTYRGHTWPWCSEPQQTLHRAPAVVIVMFQHERVQR